MKPGTELFELVRSMSPAEKGYFRRYASRHIIGEKNDYIALFDALNNQQEYDEAALRVQYAEESFVGRLAATKHYLYSLLLESMRAYRAGADATRTVLELLADVEFLWEKGLYRQCRKRLLKARTLAVRSELDTLLPHIIDLEKRQRGYDADTDAEGDGSGDTLYTQSLDALRRVENTAHYKHLNYKLSRLIDTRGDMVDQLSDATAIVAHPLLADEGLAIGTRSRISFHQTLWLYHQFVMHDIEQCYTHNLRILEELEANVDFTAERPSLLVTAVCQYLTRCILLGRKDEYESNLYRLDTLPDRLGPRPSERLRVDLLVEGVIVRLLACMAFGEYEAGAAYIASIGNEVRSSAHRIDRDGWLALCFNIAVVCFHGGHYRQALDWLNDVLHFEADVRADTYCAAQLFSLVIHVELGNRQLLEYAVRSVSRYLAKHEQIGWAEAAVLRFLRRLPGLATEEQQLEHFVLLRDELLSAPDDAVSLATVARFDMIGWLNRRIAAMSPQSESGAPAGNERS